MNLGNLAVRAPTRFKGSKRVAQGLGQITQNRTKSFTMQTTILWIHFSENHNQFNNKRHKRQKNYRHLKTGTDYFCPWDPWLDMHYMYFVLILTSWSHCIISCLPRGYSFAHLLTMNPSILSCLLRSSQLISGTEKNCQGISVFTAF